MQSKSIKCNIACDLVLRNKNEGGIATRESGFATRESGFATIKNKPNRWNFHHNRID